MAGKISNFTLGKRGLRLAINNIWRNRVMSVATIFVMGIILFIFNIILAVNFIATDALTDLSKKIDMVVYLKDTVSTTQIKNIEAEIAPLPGVTNVAYTSKEEALEKIKQTHPNLSLAFEKYDLGNPLPASINITTSHPKYHENIAEFLSQEKYQAFFSNVITDNGENNAIMGSVSKNLLTVSNFTEQVIFWLITIFIIGGALIILNALQITIFTRRKEIEVMKLVGASYFFIRLPFIIESIIYGLLSIILSLLMLFLVSQKIVVQDTNLLNYFANFKFQIIFLVELIITIILSVGSSMIAVHEHLSRK